MTDMTSTYDKVKIHEALELLDAAASEGASGLKEIVGDNYESFKDFASTLGSNVRHRLSDAYSAGSDKVRVAAGHVDKHVHANPWAYIGGGAALGLMIGVLIARSRK